MENMISDTKLRNLVLCFFCLNNVVAAVVGRTDLGGYGAAPGGEDKIGGRSLSQPKLVRTGGLEVESSGAKDDPIIDHNKMGSVIRGRDLSQPVAIRSDGSNMVDSNPVAEDMTSGRNKLVGKDLSQPLVVRSRQFNVKSFGARGDGRTDESKAFTEAWNAACRFEGVVTLLIPEGTYLMGPVKFGGPCKYVKSITVQMKGHLKATTDMSKYGSRDAWVMFESVQGLTLVGGGTFDGQGSSDWRYDQCPHSANCKLLPMNVKFVGMTNTVVQGITSLNSKFFHIGLVQCKNFKGSGIRIAAPADSPNTDGIHMDRSHDVLISESVIGTGDDCISIGQGNTQITITGIRCGPGHGISVGSLGRYPNEKNVKGLVVRDCTMMGTVNGIRIKTWANSPSHSTASNMIFENIVMNNVGNPILINQAYCPFTSCALKAPSRVKLRNITFKNIRGTTSSPVAVMLRCSKGSPCEKVNLEDVHLDFSSGGRRTKSLCQNVRAKYSGTQIPPPCVGR